MYLVVSEHSKDVKFRVGGEALTLPHTGDHPCHKCAVAQTWTQHKSRWSVSIVISSYCQQLRFIYF